MQLPSKQLLNLISDTVIIVNQQGDIHWVNDNIKESLGYTADELVGTSIDNLVPKRTRNKHESLRNSFLKKPNKRSMNDGVGLSAIHKNHQEIPVSIGLNHFEELGEKFTLCSLRLLTEKELITSTIQKLHERLEYSQTLAHVGTWDWDIVNGTLVWTDETYRIYGAKPQEFPATYDAFIDTIHSDDRQSVIDAINNALNFNKPYNIQHRVVKASGEIATVLEKGHIIRNESGQPTRMIGAVLDITQLSDSKNKLKRLAHYDDITQVPNRVLCREEIDTRIERALSNKKTFALLYIDLDNFKNINDTQGHLVGDEFLHHLAQKLSSFIPEEMFLARIGGDEFVIITDYCDDESEINHQCIDFCQKLNAFITTKKSYENLTVNITASIGVAFYPNHGANFKSLLSAADQAMYQVKNKQKNNYAIYHPNIEEKRLRELQLISDIAKGLEYDQFTVHYQAKQNLKTNELIGCEALIRWQHPTMGNIPPLEFISLAENAGLIIPLGQFVLEQSCLFVKEWREHSEKPIVVSVNVSAQQLNTVEFKTKVLETINHYGISTNEIELEITESMLMENIEATIQTLKELRAMGLSISIDDFGTGYSSLSYLQKLPIDTLKIDKSFIDLLTSSDDTAWLVANTISLALGLKLNTIAEGVETQEQKSILSSLGCNAIQGYFYSKPIEKNDFFLKFK